MTTVRVDAAPRKAPPVGLRSCTEKYWSSSDLSSSIIVMFINAYL